MQYTSNGSCYCHSEYPATDGSSYGALQWHNVDGRCFGSGKCICSFPLQQCRWHRKRKSYISISNSVEPKIIDWWCDCGICWSYDQSVNTANLRDIYTNLCHCWFQLLLILVDFTKLHSAHPFCFWLLARSYFPSSDTATAAFLARWPSIAVNIALLNFAALRSFIHCVHSTWM